MASLFGEFRRKNDGTAWWLDESGPGPYDDPATPVAQALRQASLRLLRDPRYRHPFYSAGFVVVGVS